MTTRSNENLLLYICHLRTRYRGLSTEEKQSSIFTKYVSVSASSGSKSYGISIQVCMQLRRVAVLLTAKASNVMSTFDRLLLRFQLIHAAI